ncbi:MAG: hypothetical protein Q8O17_04745 [Candidatus Methanoperedens sp.]|nr:hypothetical protein [Candidatus Methanoperedens sp.]
MYVKLLLNNLSLAVGITKGDKIKKQEVLAEPKIEIYSFCDHEFNVAKRDNSGYLYRLTGNTLPSQRRLAKGENMVKLAIIYGTGFGNTGIIAKAMAWT